jgi:hypothetical protein
MSRKQKSAVLNQTVFPHELNNGITQRTTDFAVVNKNCSFIDGNTIQKYVVMYLTKYGIPKEKVITSLKSGEVLDVQWRDNNMLIRITSEGESTNLLVKIFAQFYTKGYLMNGYTDEKQVYELSVSHVPSAILSANIGDHYATIFTSPIEELDARIAAGINKRVD